MSGRDFLKTAKSMLLTFPPLLQEENHAEVVTFRGDILQAIDEHRYTPPESQQASWGTVRVAFVRYFGGRTPSEAWERRIVDILKNRDTAVVLDLRAPDTNV